MTIASQITDLGPVSPNGSQDGEVASVTVPDGELWYIDFAYWILSTDGSTNISDTNFELEMVILDENASTSDQTGVRTFTGTTTALGGDLSTAQGLIVNFSDTRGAVTTIDKYVTGFEKIAVHEASDSTSTDGAFDLRFHARQII